MGLNNKAFQLPFNSKRRRKIYTFVPWSKSRQVVLYCQKHCSFSTRTKDWWRSKEVQLFDIWIIHKNLCHYVGSLFCALELCMSLCNFLASDFFAGLFRVSAVIESGCQEDLEKPSGSFTIIKWSIRRFVYQWHHFVLKIISWANNLTLRQDVMFCFIHSINDWCSVKVRIESDKSVAVWYVFWDRVNFSRN